MMTPEQILFMMGLDLLPKNARSSIQDSANFTALQGVKLYDMYITHLYGVMKTPVEKKLLKQDVTQFREGYIRYFKTGSPLDGQVQENFESMRIRASRVGMFIAPFGVMGLLGGSLIYPGMILTVAWGFLTPSLIEPRRFGAMLEQRYKNDLTWGYKARDTYHRVVAAADPDSAPRCTIC
jgi:hypothetical protein